VLAESTLPVRQFACGDNTDIGAATLPVGRLQPVVSPQFHRITCLRIRRIVVLPDACARIPLAMSIEVRELAQNNYFEDWTTVDQAAKATDDDFFDDDPPFG
jgi:hypothetical protein